MSLTFCKTIQYNSTNNTHHSNSISDPNNTQHDSSVVLIVAFLNHVFRQVEVRDDEPDEQYDSAETEAVEGHLLEERHVEHVGETAYTVVVPFL